MQMIIYRCLSTGKAQGQCRLENKVIYIVYLPYFLVTCCKPTVLGSILEDPKTCACSLQKKKEYFSKLQISMIDVKYNLLLGTNYNFAIQTLTVTFFVSL